MHGFNYGFMHVTPFNGDICKCYFYFVEFFRNLTILLKTEMETKLYYIG